MAKLVDSAADAAEVYEGLAGWRTSPRLEDPADTYRVLGEVSGSVRLLRQVLDQFLVLMLITGRSRSPTTTHPRKW